MPSTQNLLIVEDDDDWCAVYTRAAAKEQIDTVKVAKNLSDADALIDELQFAVAFIDIGLNVSDDQDVDGVRVMSKIRSVGDETSIIVVTGRHNQDVIPITRDAIRKYEVYDILQKSEIEPRDIRKFLVGGVAEFAKKVSVKNVMPYKILMGGASSWKWESDMLGAINAKGGIQGFYAFLEVFLAELLPLVVPRSSTQPIVLNTDEGFAHGSFWSRSLGKPITIIFGNQHVVDERIDAAVSRGGALLNYPTTTLLKRSAGRGLSGGVFSLPAARSGFSDLRS